MATPITPKTRQHIITLHKAGHTRNQIAREAGVAPATVTKICKQEGLTFNRDHTRAAVAAHQIDNKARREELKTLLLDDAHKLRAQLWQPTRLLNFGGKDNTLNQTTLDEPLFIDKKNILTAVGVAIDRFIKLDDLDNQHGINEAETMIHKLIEGLGIPDE